MIIDGGAEAFGEDLGGVYPWPAVLTPVLTECARVVVDCQQRPVTKAALACTQTAIFCHEIKQRHHPLRPAPRARRKAKTMMNRTMRAMGPAKREEPETQTRRTSRSPVPAPWGCKGKKESNSRTRTRTRSILTVCIVPRSWPDRRSRYVSGIATGSVISISTKHWAQLKIIARGLAAMLCRQTNSANASRCPASLA